MKNIPRYNFDEDIKLQMKAIGWKVPDLKVIFLDIDGVLNGYNRRTYLLIDILKLFRVPVKFMNKWLDIFGIKEKYVRRLSKIVNKTGAKVVMSSSWRHGYWNKPYEKMYSDQKKLHDLLQKYNIEIIGITPSDEEGVRENEIKQWLSSTDIQVESFVILDDESYDLQSFVGNRLVKTSCVIEGKMIQGLAYEDTGLKRKHMRQAIEILNGGNINVPKLLQEMRKYKSTHRTEGE